MPERSSSSPADVRRFVASVYAGEARDYRQLWAPSLHRVSHQLVDHLPRARDVLDVGTGVGTLLPTLQDRLGAHRVVGVDLTHEMLTLAPSSFARIAGDAAHLPFASLSFDVVVAAFVLFHLARPQDAITDANRVLRGGGTLGVITWESDSGTRALDAWNDELGRHGAPDVPASATHETVDRPEKVAALLEGRGFTEVRAWTLALTDEIGPDEFIQRRLRLGATSRRLRSLDPETRSTCISAATDRIRRLSPADFVADWRFVLATARA